MKIINYPNNKGGIFIFMELMIEFCLQAVALFKSYFGGAFDEDAIRNNFVLIYELLDGM